MGGQVKMGEQVGGWTGSGWLDRLATINWSTKGQSESPRSLTMVVVGVPHVIGPGKKVTPFPWSCVSAKFLGMASLT